MTLISIVTAFAGCMTSDSVSKEQFVTVMRSLDLFKGQPDDTMEKFFGRLDPDSTGTVHAEELTTALALFTPEKRKEKLALCFNMYDMDTTGLNKDQVEALFKAEFMGSIKGIQAALEINLGATRVTEPEDRDAAAVVLTTLAEDVYANLQGDVLAQETAAKAFFANKKDPVTDPEAVLTHAEFKRFVSARHFVSTSWFDVLASWEKN